jgi:hypothetical protein
MAIPYLPVVLVERMLPLCVSWKQLMSDIRFANAMHGVGNSSKKRFAKQAP